MNETTNPPSDVHLEPLTIEEVAWEDAAVDRQLAEPLWYPQCERWARTGVIGEEAWRRYRAAYIEARNGALPAPRQVLG